MTIDETLVVSAQLVIDSHPLIEKALDVLLNADKDVYFSWANLPWASLSNNHE